MQVSIINSNFFSYYFLTHLFVYFIPLCACLISIFSEFAASSTNNTSFLNMIRNLYEDSEVLIGFLCLYLPEVLRVFFQAVQASFMHMNT